MKLVPTLRPAQKHYIAVWACDGLVDNGGWYHYFSCAGRNDWLDALGGLEAMGSVERLSVLREATAKFGKSGPSRNQERREDQLAKLERKDDDVFDELDDRWVQEKEVIKVLTTRYVLKNAEAFE